VNEIDESAIDAKTMDGLTAVIGLWATAKRAGQPTGLVSDMLFHAETGEVLGPNHKFKNDLIGFCDLLTYAKSGRVLTDAEVIVLGVRANQHGIDVRSSKRVRAVASSMRPRRWWQFWKQD
jgi:hypothetical protein